MLDSGFTVTYLALGAFDSEYSSRFNKIIILSPCIDLLLYRILHGFISWGTRVSPHVPLRLLIRGSSISFHIEQLHDGVSGQGPIDLP